MTILELRFLGGLTIQQEGRPLGAVKSQKGLALLSYLALTATTHPRPELAGLLWPEMPERSARMNLRKVLSQLNRHLAPYLLINRHNVALNPDAPHWLDVIEFETGVGATAEISRLHNAVALYGGDFLEHFTLPDAPEFEAWVLARRAHLRELALSALDRLVRHCAATAEFELAITYARQLLAIEPWREEAHRELMHLLALADQRSAALMQYERCRRILAEELDVAPTAETTVLYERIKAGALEERSAREMPPLLNWAHPATPLIGREAELTELAALLENRTCRLITVLGPGGIGKTRLAFQASLEVARLFDDGICFIPLEPISSPESLVNAIAEALHLSFAGQADPKKQLLSYLRQKTILLFLDSFEHLLPAGSELLAELLSACPGVTMLVTSRERLNLKPEWLYDLRGLSYPGGARAEEINPTDYGALEMFLQQAQMSYTPISWDKEGSYVVRICQLVEGMPLAIELAASWLRTLPCQAIVAQTEEDLTFLAGDNRGTSPRHRSIHAAFDYSWQLLSEEERRTLKGLSVFWGPFQREAAENVIGCKLTTLSALVNKSLLMRSVGNRYHLHALIRHYVSIRVQASPQQEADTLARHSRYYTDWLSQQWSALTGPRQQDAAAEISLEFENVHKAWSWAVQHRRTDYLSRAIQSLFWYYEIKSLYAHAITVFAEVEKAFCGPGDTGEHLPPEERKILGRTLGWRVYFSSRYGQIEASKEWMQRSLKLLRTLDDSDALSDALLCSATLKVVSGNFVAAEEDIHTSLSLLKSAGDSWTIPTRMFFLGVSTLLQGKFAEAYQHFKDASEHVRATQDPLATVRILSFLGPAAFGLQAYEEAEMIARETLERARKIDDRWSLARGLELRGMVAQARSDHAAAQSLFKESLAILNELEDRWGAARVLYSVGLSTISLEDRTGAWQAFLDGFTKALQVQSMTQAIDLLIELAGLLCDSGDFQLVIQVLDVVLCHRATSHQSKDRASNLLAAAKTHVKSEPKRVADDLNSCLNLEDIQEQLSRRRFTA